MKRIRALVLSCLLLAGCAGPAMPEAPKEPHGHPPGSPPGLVMQQTRPVTVPVIKPATLPQKPFSDRDYDASYAADAVRITLSGDAASCEDASVQIDRSTVTVTQKGTYILSGQLNGMVIVDADQKDKVQLVLENAAIHSETCAAIYIAQADKVFLTLPEGTSNALSNGGSFLPMDGSNIDAALFSKDDITVNGAGTLHIQSPAGHGIVSKDEVTITGGVISVEAASHGITGQDCVSIDGAALAITCGKDAIQSENDEDPEKGFVYLGSGTLECSAGDNGIRATGILQIDGAALHLICVSDALHTQRDLIVNGGDITVSTQDDGFHADGILAVSGGNIAVTESYEGFEGKSVWISGGNISLICADDGINAAGGNDQSGFGGPGGDRFHTGDGSCILISGGSLYVNAAGDGVDSNGDLCITGGQITVEGPTDGGNGPLDYSGSGGITGGSLLATGSAQMAQSLHPQGQGVLFVTFATQSALASVTICDAAGNTLLAAAPAKEFASLVLSSPEIQSGQTYRVTAGNFTAEIQAQ